VTQATVPTTTGPSREQLERKIDSALDEYYDNYEVMDTTDLIQSFLPKELGGLLAEKVLMRVLDKNDVQRLDFTSQLLRALLRQNLVSQTQLESAFYSLLDIWDDLVMDSPRASNALGYIIAKGFILGYLAGNFLECIVSRPSLVSSGEAEKILALCLQTLKKNWNSDVVKNFWQKSQKSIKEFIKPQRTEEQFLVLYELKDVIS